jgi:hypothetical protein
MSGFVNKLEVSHPSPESSLPVCLRMSFLPTHLEKSRDKQERRTSLSLASSRGRGRESARGNGTPERGWSADRDRGSSFSTAVHGQGSVAQGRRQGKVWKGSGFSSLLCLIHPDPSSPSRCLACQAKVLHDRARLALFPLQSHVANPRRCAAPRFVLMLNHSPAEGTSRTPWAGCSSSFWGGRAASTPSANRMRLWPLPR